MNRQPTELKNEWVSLIPLSSAQFDQLYEVAKDPLIWEQHPNPDRYKKDVFQTYFRGAIESGGAFLITDCEGLFIGCTRFYDYVPEQSEVKIGYTFFSRSCWGKPYNKNTKILMLQYAFKFVNKVVFHVGASNIRSQKAMEKIGANLIGEEIVSYYGEDPKRNKVYEILKRDFIQIYP
jgi:RimJ/RimL family protein N-acetyltransferase